MSTRPSVGTGSILLTGAFFDGAGNFIADSSTGALAVENAMDKVIDLSDAAGNDFVKAWATAEDNGTIGIAFNTGNVIAAQSTEALSSTFMLADGLAYRYNHAARTWQTA